MNFSKFNYPFSYTPHPLVREAAERLISNISSDSSLDELFNEGKMLGVLLACSEDSFNAGDVEPSCVRTLYGFSGIAGGRSRLPGFVPPVYDLNDPDGEFKRREAEISAMKDGEEKSDASRELQKWIFDQFVVRNALGQSMTIAEVFGAQGLVPPGGTGECALPKMLNHAYAKGLRPLAFGEFWYGASGKGQVRKHGAFYPSCTGKCGPLLKFMLQGLDVEANPDVGTDAPGEPEIIFEDEHIVVAVKPSGMLSVPGKIESLSLLVWLQRKLGMRLFSCHRLDMDTSGLLVFAKSAQVQAAIQRQFEDRMVEKTYLALLDGGSSDGVNLEQGMKGRIELPMCLDYYDRPRQMVDFQLGKPAVTDYEILECSDNCCHGGVLVRFIPHTGRTHQLRVHAAHDKGLGCPIKGDRLYGGGDGRLMLHAAYLAFSHPATGERMEFRCDPDWE